MADAAPPRVTYDFVTRAIARTLGNPGTGYFALLAAAVALLGVGITCLLFLLRYGLGLAGYSHPVYWAVYITCFVFWVGIAHSGTLISAILFLFRSGWRTAVYRTAEACPLGHADLGDPVPVPLRLAHRGLPHRRGDDRVRGDDGGPVPTHPHRSPVVLLLADPVSQRARPVAQLQVAAHLARVRDRPLLHRLDRVPDPGSDPGHRGAA